MDISDLVYSCERIAAISNIPLRIYKNNIIINSFSLDKINIDPIKPFEKDLLEFDSKVSYYITPFHQYYGIVKHLDLHIVLGPLGTTSYTLQERQDYAFKLGINFQEFDELLEYLRMIPPFAIENFLHMLLMINFYFNNEKLNISDIQTSINSDLDKNMTDIEMTVIDFNEKQAEIDDKPLHNTLEYERQMLAHVKAGNIEELKSFLANQIHGNVGTLSDKYLRHYKNIFIVSTTLVCRAAIEGGMFENEAMSMSDIYIQNCENLFSIESIFQLQYQMLINYAEKVSKIRHNLNVSPFVGSVASFIKNNISMDLDTSILSHKFNLSRNILSAKFKSEIGVSPSVYILNERIERSKFLLKNTDRTLLDIATYLGFSSQSHFQNRFRTATGLTPTQYRNNG